MNFVDQDAQRQAKAFERKAREEQTQRDEVVATILRTPSGRKWLYQKLEMCSVGATPWVPDPHATAFNCGQQNIGFQLLADIMSASPDLYVTMCQENSNGRSAVERPSDPESDPDGADE